MSEDSDVSRVTGRMLWVGSLPGDDLHVDRKPPL